jgi:spore coat polysaccharide biosynthesis protein SpsF
MDVAVIQARMGSSRLPGKTLMKLGTYPLIHHVIRRVSQIFEDKFIYLATTDDSIDNDLVHYVQKNFKINVYRGSSKDVRSRFIDIARITSAEIMVRITADDPFKDPNHINKAIQTLKNNNADYYNNFERPIYPTGMDVECFRTKILEMSALHDSCENSKEHVTLGLRNSVNINKIYDNSPPEERFLNFRLTIDTIEDLNFCRKLLEINPELTDLDFSWEGLRNTLIEYDKCL